MERFTAYFRDIYGITGLREITFAKAVNSRERLAATLCSPTHMFIDADITKGTDGQAICAHWPARNSDLSFDDLLRAMQATKQGLKLDFKDSEIVSECLLKLNRMELTQPIILNADLLSLKGAPTPDFDAQQFLATCRTLYPQGILSIGWRTIDDPKHPYATKDIKEMLQLVNGITPIIFPIRASLLQASWPQIGRLIENPQHGLSLWNGTPVSVALTHWIDTTIDPASALYEFS